MFEVTVDDTFAAGHYLRNYKGKCENPHGHNYKIRVTLAGAELDKAGLLLDFKDLREVMKQRTAILVAHRISTVKGADQIIVMREGRLIARGTHDQLLALGGYYADLHRKQLLEEELERE